MMAAKGTLQSIFDPTLCDAQNESEQTPSKVDPEIISPPQPIGSYLVDESVLEGTTDRHLPRKSASTNPHQHFQYRAQN